MRTETYRIIFEEMLEGVAICEIVRDWKGRPVDYRFRAINPAFARMMEVEAQDTIGRLARETSIPFIEEFSQALEGTLRFELGFPSLNRQFGVIAFSHGDELVLIFHDQSELLNAKEEADLEQRRLETMLDSLPVGVVITDSWGGLLKMNRHYSETWGGALPDAHSIAEYEAFQGWWAESGEPLRSEEWGLSRAIRYGETALGEIIDIRRFDGLPATVIHASAPIRDRQQQIIGAISIVQDITYQRQLERRFKEQAAKLKTIFEQAPVGLIFLDRTLRFQRINAEAARLQGKNPEELIGRTAEEVFSEYLSFTNKESVLRVLRTALETGKRHSFHGNALPWRKKLYVDWAIQRVEDPDYGPLGLMIMAQDSTQRQQAEQQMQESEERFRKAILEAPSPIMIHAEDGEVLQINKAWSELTGYTPEEIPTIEAWTTKAFGRRKRSTRKLIERLYELEASLREGEFSVRTKQGDVRIWELCSAPLGRSRDGRRLVLSMANDVTDRKRVEEELKRLNGDLEGHISARTAQLVAINQRLEKEIADRRQAEQELKRASRALRVLAETNHAISNTDEPLALLSEACRILVEVGGFCLAWIGESQSDQTMHPLASVGCPLERLQDFKSPEMEYLLAASQGERVIIQELSASCLAGRAKGLAALPLSLGDQYGRLFIFSSETQAFTPEELELLEQLAKNLSFGLGALEERQERERLHAEKIRVLEQGETLKDEFLSVMSHELRTPLNVITGFGSLLLDEAAGPLTPEQQEFLGKMLDNADRMITVVEGLLDYAGIRAGRLAIFPSKQDYAPLILDALHTVERLAGEKKIKLRQEIRVPQAVSFDGQRLLQTMKHLLSNAVKFTPEGGEVQVKAFIEGRDLVTEMQDTGIGIAPEDLPRLFQPFHQLDMSLTRENGGTGIGLSICKAIVEAHGGTITASSEGPGQGSTFRFVLPLL